MAKSASDLILRDRLQFDLDNTGDRTTVYGRFDLSEFVSTLDRKGLSIKEINFQLRDPTSGNCGNYRLAQGKPTNVSSTSIQYSSMKLYATTRAYENANQVGIASPDVLHVETFDAYLGPQPFGSPSASSTFMEQTHMVYPVQNLHPDGFPVVTDLLIGIATDGWDIYDDQTIELDVMIVAAPITITQKQLTEMLVQGQDQ